MKTLHRSRSMCEWHAFADESRSMRAMLDGQSPGLVPPFLYLAEPGISASDHRLCAELWTQERRAAAHALREVMDFRFYGRKRKKIRIGYLSNDFHDHATALLMVEMLEAHDRDNFEIIAYSYGADDGKPMRQRLYQAFDDFHSIADLTDQQAASAIYGDGIDILVDLKGFTQNSRTRILMLRPAPILVSFLGYPGTLGDGVCDYIITDSYVTPPQAIVDYSESFALMPHSYQPHGRLSLQQSPPSRQEMGLPEDGFVFCCFNQTFKINPSMFTLWCRLLEVNPGSVLWLLDSDTARGNLRNEAQKRGIGGHRLVFAPHTNQIHHLERLQLADLVLDTSPYGAHTTASDALWAGVPLITHAGETFASRVAGSLLRAVGLDELIADDFDRYFELAYELATDPHRLAALKSRLIANSDDAPLFDVPLYTRNLEALYQAMWNRHHAGQSPGTLQILP